MLIRQVLGLKSCKVPVIPLAIHKRLFVPDICDFNDNIHLWLVVLCWSIIPIFSLSTASSFEGECKIHQ